MRVALFFCVFVMFTWGINYNVIPSDGREGRYSTQANQGKLSPTIIPPPPQNQSNRQNNLGVQIKPSGSKAQNGQRQPLPVQVQSRPMGSSSYDSAQNHPNVFVSPPLKRPNPQAKQELNVRVYPPTVGQDTKDNPNTIHPDVSPSRPITQDMMFQKMPQYKMKLPPRKKKIVQVQPQPTPPPMQDEYEDEDSEPLFIRNRNGVMIGAGIGGSFDRLWVGGSGGSARFYDSAFSYYFRLGYQYYFTHYLGIRAYANLGDWSNRFSTSFFDGNRHVSVEAKLNFNYSFFAEILYDFVVLRNHSFGIFGGFGLGVSYGEFSNDGTETISEYYAMPAISFGFAYTLFENNRFELETKVPLRSEVLKKQWRSELSTWMIGVSYTYIF